MKWINASERAPIEWNSRTVVRFIHTKLVLHEVNNFLNQYPDRKHILEWLDESPTPEAVFEKWLIGNYQWNGRGWIEIYATSGIVRTTKYLYNRYCKAVEKNFLIPQSPSPDSYREALETLLNELPENRPLYRDSGLWQVRSDDMEDVICQQQVNETFLEFIDRYQNDSARTALGEKEVGND